MLAVLRSPRPRELGAAAVAGIALLVAVYIALQGVGGFGGWLRLVPLTDPVADTMEAVEEAAPQLAGLEAVAPALHARLMAVVRRDVQLGLDRQRIVADVIEEFGDWRADALPDAPDRVILAYLALAIDRLHELSARNPALCAAITLGDSAGDTTPFVSAQHLQREMNADRMLLRAQPDEAFSRMTRAEAQAIARENELRLQRAFGTSAALLDAGQPQNATDIAIVCRMGIAMMEAIAALEPPRAAAAARNLFFSR